jgi:hypothetical protein
LTGDVTVVSTVASRASKILTPDYDGDAYLTLISSDWDFYDGSLYIDASCVGL